jgi:hypothetical protein
MDTYGKVTNKNKFVSAINEPGDHTGMYMKKRTGKLFQI